jgi:hypothetical protein
VASIGEDAGFVENGWIGRTASIGNSVRLAITEPCSTPAKSAAWRHGSPVTEDAC